MCDVEKWLLEVIKGGVDEAWQTGNAADVAEEVYVFTHVQRAADAVLVAGDVEGARNLKVFFLFDRLLWLEVDVKKLKSIGYKISELMWLS